MWNWLYEASGASIYYQHAICLTNDPMLMALYIIGDLGTWAAYMVIGGTLLFARVSVLRFSTAALMLYGAFIFLCGLSHLTKTVTLFTGAYRIDVLVVAVMAIVSTVTAVFTVNEVLFKKPAAS